ncbi:UNVERIFIED_CONTAM: argininosuccinate lyase, partial [Salmonella enterica subsp. enterica serovar Weltevreden]
RVGLLSQEELEAILEGLERIEKEIEAGTFPWREELEDVHMNLEARLIELVGPPGGKLHTARSRNDQVATDLRLFLRGAIDELLALLLEL